MKNTIVIQVKSRSFRKWFKGEIDKGKIKVIHNCKKTGVTSVIKSKLKKKKM